MSAANKLKTVEPQGLQQVPATVTPASLLAMAVQQGADLDKLQQLMDLQDRWDANQARKAYIEAMAGFKTNPPEIFKTKRVSYGNTEYKHATIGDVTAAIIDGLSAHGLSHRWDIDQSGGIKVTCVLTHRMGHSESTVMQAPADQSGGKNAIQAIASTVTYLQRYTLLAATGLATQDEVDDDGGSGDTDEDIARRQAEQAASEFAAKTKAAQEQYADSIIVIKDNLVTGGEVSIAAEAWFELSDDTKSLLWVAPSKGGPFTTAEREIMKTAEFRQAYYGADKP